MAWFLFLLRGLESKVNPLSESNSLSGEFLSVEFNPWNFTVGSRNDVVSNAVSLGSKRPVFWEEPGVDKCRADALLSRLFRRVY